MAQVRALVREGVLEELFAGEVLEIRIIDPALAHPFVGQPVNVLEQQQPDHEAGLDAWPALLAVERRDLAVDPVPVDLAGELHQLVLQVDDLVEPRPEQIVRPRRLVLLRPHRPLRCTTESWSAAKGNPQTKLQGLGLSSSQSLQSQMPPHPKNRLPLNRLEACSRTTKKPVGEQITDLVAVAAGALAETAVKSVAKRVRKAAAKKTPEPVKKAVKSISKVSKAPKRSAKKPRRS